MPQPIDPPVLTVRAISAVGVEVPMTYVLGTSRGRITKAPLLLIDVETAEGVTGRSLSVVVLPARDGRRSRASSRRSRSAPRASASSPRRSGAGSPNASR